MKNTNHIVSHFLENVKPDQTQFLELLREVCKKIAPVWPLENFVAVNPFLGHTHKPFEQVAQELAAAGGIHMTLPASFYLQKLEEGELLKEDIALVLRKKNYNTNVDAFIENVASEVHKSIEITAIATVIDVASDITKKDWNRFVTTRISTWAAAYFDKGQARWVAANKNEGIFSAWKFEAEIDRTTELSGLKNFRKLVSSIPKNPLEAIKWAFKKLNVVENESALYLHRLLLRMGGWAAFAAKQDWDSELYGGKDGKLIEFLAVLVCWEACLFESLSSPELKRKWKETREILTLNQVEKRLNLDVAHNLILQEAFDLATQRKLISKFEKKKITKIIKKERASAQAIFCIDVRSEIYRRNLECVDQTIETLGFAGFFAFPIKHIPIGHSEGEAQCPVLLAPGPKIMDQMENEKTHAEVLKKRILTKQLQQVWKSFKSGAISCFSFVSPIGISYLPKLFTDSFGLTRPVPQPDKIGFSKTNYLKKKININEQTINNETYGISLEKQIEMGKNALTAMSLTSNFAKFVLIVGHGSNMVNNPHATGYDCGACGGHTGEANARVVAAVLNSKEVRTGLQKANILIPFDTVFLACLHDTTTDDLTIFNEQDVALSQTKDLELLKESLSMAGKATRTERLLRFSDSKKNNTDRSVLVRSSDWSQVRPEWGLAGCSAFVVAPRQRTRDLNLEGKAFLHSYDWTKDENFEVLELIMTAPMVVTSWINLQYYGSVVDNKNYGSGNKTLHNVTSGLGVLEGYSGDLRVGLPLQALHDGERFQHEPQKLNVVIEAPIEAINSILEKHRAIRDLCDNGWLFLMTLDKTGNISHRYCGNFTWEKLEKLAA
ncbi:YbcC family protein [Roseivirga seohaensis]|uniref:YbcC family protein n=1 Tax=Roseivirga seohaensis TaxID=1914963 RepID=UPI0009E84512|nr:DUF2309 domain-containing protein [Roseivirga seohaensis]